MHAERPSFSLVVCSIDAGKLSACTARYAQRLHPRTFEVVAIADARSLAEGYTRGLREARGRWVIFSHDDAWPLSADFGARLADHLDAVDIVGVAGATRAISGFWGHAGQPDTHGHIVSPNPRTGKPDVLVWGAASPRIDGVRLLDGCFIAARRDVALEVGFDAARFDGFHLYDADFVLRAQATGRRVAVAADLTLCHLSHGDFGSAWQRYHARFIEAHAARLDRGPARRARVARLAFEDFDAAAAGVDVARIVSLTPRLRTPRRD
jgi:GT2 family glycosyltransferase